MMLWTPTKGQLSWTQATRTSRQDFSFSEMGPTTVPVLLLCPPTSIPRHTSTKVQLDPQARNGPTRVLALNRLNHPQARRPDLQATGRASPRSTPRLSPQIRMSSEVSLSEAQLLGHSSSANRALVKSNR